MTSLRTKFVSGFAALAVAGALSFGATTQANAYVANDWTLDITSIDGFGAYTVSDIDQLTFGGGIAHALTNDTDLSGGDPNTGDQGTVSGFGNIDAFKNDFTGNIATPELNTQFEMTFVFDAGIVFTSDFGTFAHTNVGSLKIYIDNLTDLVGDSTTPGNGDGYADGELIGLFTLQAGQGGSLDLTNLDGSDDASFKATWLKSGVWMDGLLDLSTVVTTPGGLVFGWTDSNFDADPLNTGSLGNTPVDGGFKCGSTLHDFCAMEDGSMRIAVPEPGTIAIFGVGLLALGLARRRRKA